MKQKKEVRITLRLTQEQYDSIAAKAETAQMLCNMGRIKEVHLDDAWQTLSQVYLKLRELAEQERT